MFLSSILCIRRKKIKKKNIVGKLQKTQQENIEMGGMFVIVFDSLQKVLSFVFHSFFIHSYIQNQGCSSGLFKNQEECGMFLIFIYLKLL